MKRYAIALLLPAISMLFNGCSTGEEVPTNSTEYGEIKTTCRDQGQDSTSECKCRLATWESCYQIEVKLDDGISDWTFEFMDSQREALYSLINNMGGVYETPDKRRPISTCRKDMISFFSTPVQKDARSIPGVLLVAPLRRSGYATFFAINSQGKLACGAIEFNSSYCTGGAVYTPNTPGVTFSTADWQKKDVYSQYRISPDKRETHYGATSPVEWTFTERTAGTYKLFSKPVVPKEYGPWVRLDNIDKLRRKSEKQKASQ